MAKDITPKDPKTEVKEDEAEDKKDEERTTQRLAERHTYKKEW